MLFLAYLPPLPCVKVSKGATEAAGFLFEAAFRRWELCPSLWPGSERRPSRQLLRAARGKMPFIPLASKEQRQTEGPEGRGGL